ncbi:MAG TPA: serine hydrolase [Elusimicrobia bacterium]|nr:serine hydrolase [Elusimicrobiota bacterium]
MLCGPAVFLLGGCSTYNKMGLGTRDPQIMRYTHSCEPKAAAGTLTQPVAAGAQTTDIIAGGCDLKTEVDSLAQPLVDGKRTPGIVVGVLLPDGSRHFYGYGVTALANGSKPDGNTLFAIGSVSKGFLGAIAAQLVRNGTLSWDDPLYKLLPAGIPLSDDAKKITLLQLATHTSGLPRQPMTLQTLRYVIQYSFTGKSFYRHFDRAFLINYLADFNAPHAVKVRYSSMGYALLGYVLELRTGKKVDALLQEYMVNPLGLKNTGYVPENLPGFAGRAHGYTGDQPKFRRRGRPTTDWDFTDIMRGSAGLYSTAEDLLTYASAHLNPVENQALSAALPDTLLVRFEQLKAAPAIAWNVDDAGGLKITRQIGFVAGYSTYLGLDVKHRTAVVVLQNSFNWDISAGPRLLLRLAEAQAK